MKEHYTDYYARHDLASWRRIGARDKANNVRTLWKGRPPPNVADVGCGDAAVAKALHEASFFSAYAGFEVSTSGIEQAKSRNIPGSNFVVFDGDRLPVKERTYDLVLLSHVLEHVDEPRRLLRECARVGDRVFVEVPLELNLRTPRDFRWTETGHVNLYNRKVLRHVVQSSGLEVESEAVTCPGRAAFVFRKGPTLGTLAWIFKLSLLKLVPSLASALLTYHGCVLARRTPPDPSSRA